MNTGKLLLFVAAVAVLWGGCESDNREARPERTAAGTKQDRPTAKSDRSVPKASISVDGKFDDWADVPVWLRNDPGVTSSYKPKAVRVAADHENLYVLFELGLGVRERFERQVPSGRVSSGALGLLNLTVDGVKHRCWLPTGFTMSVKEGRSSFELMMNYELMRAKPDADEYESVLEKEYPSDEGFFGIADRHVELKIPLKFLGAGPDSKWQITLDAF